jgi:hypothetical protein
MKSLLLLFSWQITYSIGYSQRVPNQEYQPILENKISNEIAAFGYTDKMLATFGSFQIIINNSDMQFAVSDETLIWIEEQRLIETDQTLKIDDNVLVFIPSLQSISSQEFKPFTNVRYTN